MGTGKRRGEGKGRDPQGLVDTPHVPNPEKYPDNSCKAYKQAEQPRCFTGITGGGCCNLSESTKLCIFTHGRPQAWARGTCPHLESAKLAKGLDSLQLPLC